jgi:hypothetical protein
MFAHFEDKAYLALQQFQTGATTSTNMAEFVLHLIVGNNCGSVASTDDNSGAFRCSLDVSIQQCLGAICECGEFKNSGWTMSKSKAVNGPDGGDK